MSEGYVPCACRDCFEIAIGEPRRALCHECIAAGCTPCTCADHERPAGSCRAYNLVTHRHEECQRPGAYGVDEEEP